MHLTDCFMDVIAYVTHFLKSDRQPTLDEARGEILRLLRKGEAGASTFSREDYDLARFAVCAWVDETVLASDWPHRGAWLKEQLQRTFFNTTEAGEEFFRKLDGLGLHQREVREVYYLCLMLGFAGRYCRPGDEMHLDNVKTANLKLLLGSSVGLPSLDRTDLFPEAQPQPAVRREAPRSRISTVVAVCYGGPALLFVILFVVYRLSLGSVADGFLKTLGL